MEDFLKKINGRRPTKKIKMEDNLQKNGRQPQKNWEKNGRRLEKKKKEDDLKKLKWKTTSKKIEDEPINQNQPNWL